MRWVDGMMKISNQKSFMKKRAKFSLFPRYITIELLHTHKKNEDFIDVLGVKLLLKTTPEMLDNILCHYLCVFKN